MIGQPDYHSFNTRNLSPSPWMNLFLLSPGICHRREQLSCGSFGFYWSRKTGNTLFIFNHLVCYQIFVILFPDDTTPQFLRKLNRSFDYRYYPVHKGKAQGNQRLLFQTLGWHANRLKRYKYFHNISDQNVNTFCTTGLSGTRLKKNFCHWIHRSSITSHRN